MVWIKTFLRRLRALWYPDRICNEIDDELRFHIEMRAEENVRRGMSPEDARLDAERRFGQFMRVKEEGYEIRGGGWLEDVLQDLRFALRVLVKKPGFTLVAVLTLGVGIAASTAILGVVTSVLLRPPAFPDADRLVVLYATSPERGVYRDTTSFPDLMDWKTQSSSFTEVAAYRTDPFNVTGGSTPERVPGVRASHELLGVLGVIPTLGRTFDKHDQEQQNRVALISHGLWLRRFGGDPQVLGKDVVLNDVSHSIIGVLPEGFQFPPFIDTDVLVPVPQRPSRSTGYIRGVARLRTGASLATAQAELDAIAKRLEQAFPLSNGGRGVNVVSFEEVAVGNVRTPLLVLLGAAAFVLLIGCANVGGLVLATGIARQRELAVRTILGAGSGRLIRQLLTESIFLAFLAAVVGTTLAVWGNRVLVGSLSQLYVLPAITFEWSLLAIGIGTALLAGALCALPPVLMITRSDLNKSISESGRTHSSGRKQYRLRSMLVVSETALTVVLVVGSGLLMRSFVSLQQIDLGFDPRNVLTADLVLSTRYDDAERRQIFLTELLDSVRSIPGVEEAAILSDPPFKGGSRETFTVEGVSDPGPRQGHATRFNVVSANLFRALGIPIRNGRSFNGQDTALSAGVVIVNETMAQQFWPSENPIGKRIRFYYDKSSERWLSVAGVVANARDQGREFDPRPQVFVPYQQNPYRFLPYRQPMFVGLIVRTAANPMQLANQVRAGVWSVDKDQTVSNVETMEMGLSRSVADRRLYLLLLGSFALIAVVMATAGIYGLMSYAAASRTQEMGIRVALGATSAQIIGLILRHGVFVMSIGIAIGIFGSMVLTKMLSGFLYGVTATDPATFIIMTLLFAAIGLAAVYIPARRAARIDPAMAFRYE